MRWGKVDYKELRDLEKRLKKLQERDFKKFCEDCARELAARLLAKVIKRTPVGNNVTETIETGEHYVRGSKKGQAKTKQRVIRNGGTLRRGWTAKSEAEAKSGTPGAAEYAASLPITKSGNAYEVEITNPVHYASYVEFGHRQTPGRYVPAIGKRLTQSWVPGQFMLTISEKELRAEARGILEKKLAEFMKEAFNG